MIPFKLSFFFFLTFACGLFSSLFIYLFIFGCVESSCPCEGFLQLRQAGVTLHRGARAFLYRGLSCCGAQAPDAQAQQLWLTGPVAPRHVGSSQTRARTRDPCIGRQILNHCATREAPRCPFLKAFLNTLPSDFWSHLICQNYLIWPTPEEGQSREIGVLVFPHVLQRKAREKGM